MKQILILAVFSVLVAQTGCESDAKEANEQTRYLVTSPIKMDTTIMKDYVCQIRAIQHIEVRSQERGYLQKIYVDEGQSVKKDQLLFQVMPKLYQAELEKAEAEANLAKIEYLNTKALAETNVVAPNELAMAKAKYDKAKAELSLTQVHLQFTEIRAPFDGIIDRFHVRLGSLVDEGDLLTTLSDNSKMWVYFNVPEAQYLDYKSKTRGDSLMTVSLLMANNKIFKYPGVVQTIEADFDNETGNIPFRATFPNPDGLLRHGETGNILVPVPLTDAVIIPQKASFEVLEKKYVYVVDDNNVVHSREVKIGTELEDLYAISKGVKATDKILLEGLRKVRDKDRIVYDFENPREVVTHLKLYTE